MLRVPEGERPRRDSRPIDPTWSDTCRGARAPPCSCSAARRSEVGDARQENRSPPLRNRLPNKAERLSEGAWSPGLAGTEKSGRPAQSRADACASSTFTLLLLFFMFFIVVVVIGEERVDGPGGAQQLQLLGASPLPTPPLSSPPPPTPPSPSPTPRSFSSSNSSSSSSFFSSASNSSSSFSNFFSVESGSVAVELAESRSLLDVAGGQDQISALLVQTEHLGQVVVCWDHLHTDSGPTGVGQAADEAQCAELDLYCSQGVVQHLLEGGEELGFPQGGGQQAVGFPADPGVVPGLAPLHDPLQQSLVPAQSRGRALWFLSALSPACWTDTSPSSTCCSNMLRMASPRTLVQPTGTLIGFGTTAPGEDVEGIWSRQDESLVGYASEGLVTVPCEVGDGQSPRELQLGVGGLQPGEDVLRLWGSEDPCNPRTISDRASGTPDSANWSFRTSVGDSRRPMMICELKTSRMMWLRSASGARLSWKIRTSETWSSASASRAESGEDTAGDGDRSGGVKLPMSARLQSANRHTLTSGSFSGYCCMMETKALKKQTDFSSPLLTVIEADPPDGSAGVEQHLLLLALQVETSRSPPERSGAGPPEEAPTLGSA
ncbi:hypothetical protein CRUP_031384 [Coryphaenoides rupestris]|nr:hypothetical protein CRUP_031384 [Coryphaenoides rupestris]